MLRMVDLRHAFLVPADALQLLLVVRCDGRHAFQIPSGLIAGFAIMHCIMHCHHALHCALHCALPLCIAIVHCIMNFYAFGVGCCRATAAAVGYDAAELARFFYFPAVPGPGGVTPFAIASH